MQLNHPHNRGGYRLRMSNKLQPPPKENFSVSIIFQVLPVSTHKSAKLTRLRSSRVGEADEWCEAPETISKHCVPPENSLCKQRTKPVLSSASISCQARANHEQGRAGARWTVEGDSGHVVLYGGVGGWWHGGTGDNWAPHGTLIFSDH